LWNCAFAAVVRIFVYHNARNEQYNKETVMFRAGDITDTNNYDP